MFVTLFSEIYRIVFKEISGFPNLLNEIENKPFNIDDIPIIPIRVAHSVLPILGFRIERFAYITDVSYIDDAELSKLSVGCW